MDPEWLQGQHQRAETATSGDPWTTSAGLLSAKMRGARATLAMPTAHGRQEFRDSRAMAFRGDVKHQHRNDALAFQMYSHEALRPRHARSINRYYDPR